MEVLKLSEIREVDDDSNYIGEVPEEMEVTTSGQKTGFKQQFQSFLIYTIKSDLELVRRIK